MPDIRIVSCFDLDTEGHRYYMRYPRWSEPEEVDAGVCPVCGSEGREIIPVEPIEQEDLEMAYG